MPVVSITDIHGTSFFGESLKSMVFAPPGPWMVVVFLVVAVLVLWFIFATVRLLPHGQGSGRSGNQKD